MDKAGRLVVPKALRKAVGLADGGPIDISVYGQGLLIVPTGPTARLIETDRGLVADSDPEVTDEMTFDLVDSMRR